MCSLPTAAVRNTLAINGLHPLLASACKADPRLLYDQNHKSRGLLNQCVLLIRSISFDGIHLHHICAREAAFGSLLANLRVLNEMSISKRLKTVHFDGVCQKGRTTIGMAKWQWIREGWLQVSTMVHSAYRDIQNPREESFSVDSEPSLQHLLIVVERVSWVLLDLIESLGHESSYYSSWLNICRPTYLQLPGYSSWKLPEL